MDRVPGMQLVGRSCTGQRATVALGGQLPRLDSRLDVGQVEWGQEAGWGGGPGVASDPGGVHLPVDLSLGLLNLKCGLRGRRCPGRHTWPECGAISLPAVKQPAQVRALGPRSPGGNQGGGGGADPSGSRPAQRGQMPSPGQPGDFPSNKGTCPVPQPGSQAWAMSGFHCCPPL